jgi:type I restriction enzyme M protein
MTIKLTATDLEKRLWKVADRFRGDAIQSDYPQRVLPMLLLKRVTDAPGTVTLRDGRPLMPGKGGGWASFPPYGPGVAEGLTAAFEALAEANPSIADLCRSVDYRNMRPSGIQTGRSLEGAVQLLTSLDLSDEALEDAEAIGRACDRFLEPTGKADSAHVDPLDLAELMASLAAPTAGMTVCDPSCGVARTLASCWMHVGDGPLHLYAQDKNPAAWALAQFNLLLHGIGDFDIRLGDVFDEPAFAEGYQLKAFDRIVCNPPFNATPRTPFHESDPYGRFHLAVPRSNSSELGVALHSLRSLSPDGRAVVVLTHGALSRGGPDTRVRESLIQLNVVDAVIGLPPNLLYATSIPCVLMVLSRRKSDARSGKVLFIDASSMDNVSKERGKNRLLPEAIARIAETYRHFVEADGFSKVVPTQEIAEQDFDLTIKRYLGGTETLPPIDIAAEVGKLHDVEARRHQSQQAMDDCLRQLGLQL